MHGTPGSGGKNRWLLLIHQLPPKPAYLRVKIARRLLRTGAIAIKNTVYVLPNNDQSREDFQWIVQEIVRGGGEALVCESRLVVGLQDRDLEDLFNRARNADYLALTGRARRKRAAARLKKRLSEIVAIDFFAAPGRAAAEQAVVGKPASPAGDLAGRRIRREDYRGRTWVTRQGVGIDRMGCAWLIRRFIDPAARFKFVPAKGYAPRPREVRFDMFEAEFTHEGDRCSFEVLIDRMNLDDPGLRPLAEIIHDVDLKDSKFRRNETRGLEVLVDALRERHASDEDRLARSAGVFEDLYEYFRRKRT
jgi:hypothetical protein